MGVRHDGERDLEASETEEMLPLYTESEQGPAVPRAKASDLKLPDIEATPQEIRDYFLEILTLRGIDSERASALADKWTLGSGKELREYTQEMYSGIFGAEEGWVLHSELQPKIQNEKQRDHYDKEHRLLRTWVALFLCGLTFLGSGIGILYAANFNAATFITGFALCVVGFFMTLMTSIFLITLASMKRPEE